jgi:acylphosphatase
MADARARLLIRGRVQGVFFRAFTEETARSLGLKGWVRNTPGGDVEAVFEGKKQDIERAIDLCHEGPPASNVTGIDVKWQDFKGEFPSFSVRYY